MEIVGKLWDFKHQNWVKCCTPTWRVFTKPVACVTGFAQRGLIHASNFSTLRKCNSTHVWSGALKFGSRTFLSHYVYKRKFYFNNLLSNEVSYASSKFQITCVYKILFHKSGHTSDLLNLSKQLQMSLNNYIFARTFVPILQLFIVSPELPRWKHTCIAVDPIYTTTIVKGIINAIINIYLTQITIITHRTHAVNVVISSTHSYCSIHAK